MTLPTSVPPMAGSKDLLALVAFLTDPAAVKARHDELAELEARVTAKLAEVGVVNDASGYLLRAKADRSEAADLKAQAQAAVEAAAREAAAARADLAREREALAAELRAFEMERADATRRVEAVTRDLAARETAVGVAEARVASLRAAAEAAKTEYEGRLARLKAATA